MTRALGVLLVAGDRAFELIGLACEDFAALFTQDTAAMQRSFETTPAP